MKIFQIQIKNPNHPTGSYRRDGAAFKVNKKTYAEEISNIIAADKNLKVSEVESAKGMDVLKKIGNAPFVKPKTEKPNEKPEEKPREKEKQSGPGFLGKIMGKAPDKDAEPEKKE